MKTSDYASARPTSSTATTTGPTTWRHVPVDRHAARACNEVFDRLGGVLRDAFSFARRLGIKTCLGTETPLAIPDGREEAVAGGRQGPGRPGRGAGGLRRHVPADQPDAIRWITTGSGRRKAGPGGRGQPAADRRDAGRLPRGDRGRRQERGPRSPWPPAAGCSARRNSRPSSTKRSPRRCP